MALKVPVATYRLQFNERFGFQDAKAIVAYLNDLGITDLYASPIFWSRVGSSHGYDVVDPNSLNPELGTEADFDDLMAEVQRTGLGWLQDIVPNHMAYDGENRILMDVFENGQRSCFVNYFDIDWDYPYESLKGKVLAPFLGEFYGRCLEDGEIHIRYDVNGLSVNYFKLRFPLYIESYVTFLTHNLGSLRRSLGADHPGLIKLLDVLYALKNLPSQEETKERVNQVLFAKRTLWELYNSSGPVQSFIQENIQWFNGRKGHPESFNSLDQLLSEQPFRLSYWKVASEEINYRRFFNINELISLRMEDDQVFESTHALIFRLIQEKKITGLRIDHIDGLYDPTRYLNRLREKAQGLYHCIEKILDFDEQLPSFWPVEGTTGYDFLNYVNGLFCDQNNEKKFSQLYSRFIGVRVSYPELVWEKKRLIIGKYMAGDVDNLAHLLKAVSSRDRFGSDITLYGLKRALVEVLTFFPVYRSYVTSDVFREEDRSYIQTTMARAKEHNPALLHELDFIEQFLLLDFPEHVQEEEKNRWLHFVMRLQQLTGPLMAKGFEDTTLYAYNRLLSLNEVGGSPDRFGTSVRAFHKFNLSRREQWPHGLSATSTHDTKRGEDARMRINVLSEIPEEWDKKLKSWSKLNKNKKTVLKNGEAPDRNDEYFLYQALIGSYPADETNQKSFRERLKNYIIKAVREAKIHTEWVKPDNVYEEAFVSFIDSILDSSEKNAFFNDFLSFMRTIAYYGMLNSLGQTLLKICSPGIPDFYQGTELWDLTFVDPDNRRPVDFEKRTRLLEKLKKAQDLSAVPREVLDRWEDGRIKLFLTYKALVLRRDRSEVFLHGDYIPLEATRANKEHVFAFARQKDGAWVVTVVPRLLTRLVSVGEFPLGRKVWGKSVLLLPEQAPKDWLNSLTGETLKTTLAAGKKALPLHRVFQRFPVALLSGTSAHG